MNCGCSTTASVRDREPVGAAKRQTHMPESLHRDPFAGDDAARLLDGAADELATLAGQLHQDDCGNGWLGDCREGRDWHRLLSAQTTSLRSLLAHHAENLSTFAARLRAADAAYRDTERDAADRYPT